MTTTGSRITAEPRRSRRGRPRLIEVGWNAKTGTWSRPTDTTESPVGELLRHMLAGSFLNAACEAAGVSTSVVKAWCARGREHTPDGESWTRADVPADELVFVDFLTALTRSEARAEVVVTAKLYEQAVGGDVRAALEWLGRRHPDRWREQTRHAVELQPASPLRPGSAESRRLAQLLAERPDLVELMDRASDLLDLDVDRL